MTITDGHEMWAVTESVRLLINMAEMGFLCQLARLILIERVRSSDLCAASLFPCSVLPSCLTLLTLDSRYVPLTGSEVKTAR